MREIFLSIIGVIISVAAILFAVANRGLVPVVWSPLNAPAQLPLYAVGLGGITLGFCLGAALVWFDAGSLRAERRSQRRKIDKLERALGREHELSDPADHPLPGDEP